MLDLFGLLTRHGESTPPLKPTRCEATLWAFF
jgi:hypothetical protein